MNSQYLKKKVHDTEQVAVNCLRGAGIGCGLLRPYLTDVWYLAEDPPPLYGRGGGTWRALKCIHRRCDIVAHPTVDYSEPATVRPIPYLRTCTLAADTNYGRLYGYILRTDTEMHFRLHARLRMHRRRCTLPRLSPSSPVFPSLSRPFCSVVVSVVALWHLSA